MCGADTGPDEPGRVYRAVALDAMGVLYRSSDDVTDLLIPYARAHGSPLSGDEILALYVECSLGRMTARELWERARVAGADDDEYVSRFELTEGVVPALERLAACGLRLACLSNDVAEWSLLLRRRFGLERYIETWVISGDIGFRKPRPEAFAALAAALCLEPSRILFVDDRLPNVRAARAAGLGAALFGPGVPELDEDGRPTVRDMASLADLFAPGARRQSPRSSRSIRPRPAPAKPATET